MSDYTSFESRPEWEDAPEECQYGPCEKTPTRWVRFRRPKEYVCYCREHGEQMEGEMVNACRSAQLA